MEGKVDYRIQALESKVDKLVRKWKKQGLMSSEFERIGLILCERYKGKEQELKDLGDRASKTRKEAEEFLNKIRNDKK